MRRKRIALMVDTRHGACSESGASHDRGGNLHSCARGHDLTLETAMKFVYCWLFVSLASGLWAEATTMRSAPMVGLWAATEARAIGYGGVGTFVRPVRLAAE